ncbi:hypothetical protein KIW84_020632 [Lathyrus oleraceus]|uniref:Retrotransposon gag domain-containing protein n=1 Tax=Pisum sativum TaxID=3888 RepID=A0A9D5B2V7_PEA|nr:hypothetical protein KIW84_020632 [Pisum sativum]
MFSALCGTVHRIVLGTLVIALLRHCSSSLSTLFTATVLALFTVLFSIVHRYCLRTTKEIWKALKKTYAKTKDAAQIYYVKVKTLGTKQGNKIITKYVNHLKALWVELDHYRVIKTKCTTDATKLREYIEQDRVYDFLVGLNSYFDHVRVQILGKEKILNINDVVSIVRNEERMRELMLTPPSMEISTLLVKKSSTMLVDQKKLGETYVEKKGERVWCTYCNKPRHTREKC